MLSILLVSSSRDIPNLPPSRSCCSYKRCFFFELHAHTQLNTNIFIKWLFDCYKCCMVSWGMVSCGMMSYGMPWYGVVCYRIVSCGTQNTRWSPTISNLTSPQSSTAHFGRSNSGHSLTKHFCITSGLKCTGHFTTGSITVTFSPFWSMVCLHMRSLPCWPSPHVLEQACHSCGSHLNHKQNDISLYKIKSYFVSVERIFSGVIYVFYHCVVAGNLPCRTRS